MFLQSETEAKVTDGTKQTARHRLIFSAAILFQRRGYYGVRTEDILRLADAPRGSLYHHFPDGKISLACAAVDWVANEAVTYTQQLRLAGKSPQHIVNITLKGIIKWMDKTDCSEISIFSAISACLDAQSELVLRTHVSKAYSLLIGEYQQMLRVCSIDKKTAEQIAQTIITEVEGASVLAKARGDTQPLKIAQTRLMNLLNTTIIARGASSAL